MMKHANITPFIARRVNALASLSLIALLCSQLFDFWILELLSHFVPYYAILFLLAILTHKAWMRLFWGIISALVIAWLMQSHAFTQHSNQSARLRVIWYNVHLDNPEAQTESQRLIAEQADILALAEIDTANPQWQPLRQVYPHGCTFESDSPFALAVWSKQPLSDCQIHLLDDAYPYIRATTQVDGEYIALYALHPPPPITSILAQSREHYLNTVAERMSQDRHVLALGDLNSSPFSPLFRQVLDKADLRPQTPYYLPTWKPFFLNIDHVLLRSDTAQVNAYPLAWQGSDHRPIKIEWY